ncbi:LamB/YcsF family protein [Rhodobacteraceae bacterium XHP0102]|nr:LamB/YcsF family protein [Rhodobacteraceae bacterium XHP0102]
MKVDLNADLGEGFGPWPMGADAAMMDVISSANIACGFHAGDPDQMLKSMSAAVARGVGLGAHPGFPDLQGFGRRQMQMSHEEVTNMVTYQTGAAMAMARAAGGRLRHIKLHGALANMAADDAALARAAYEGALRADPELIVMVIASTAQEDAALSLDVPIAREIFADRAYLPNARLQDRRVAGAVIHDPQIVAARILTMLREGAIVAEDGTRSPTPIDTICLHGDTPQAVEIARNLRKTLEAEGINIAAF